MKSGQEILYLGNADVEACGLTPAEVETAVEAMFAAKAAGRTEMKPKLALNAAQGPLFLASPAALEAPAYAGVKWVGVADSDATGLPHIAGLILLSDATNAMRSTGTRPSWGKKTGRGSNARSASHSAALGYD